MRWKSFKMLFRQTVIGYFAPVLVLPRLLRKHSWNYVRQLKAIYRYVERR
jgi:hypothetical protein